MELINECWLDFCIILSFKCKMCNITRTVHTEPPGQEADSLNVNALAVSGMIATGSGYSQLEEICAALNMSCISRDTWNTYHDQVSEAIHATAWELLTEVAKEEAALAKEVGEVGKEGCPLITVRRCHLAFQNKRKGSAMQSYSADLDYGPDAYRIEEDISEKAYEEKKETFLSQLMREDQKKIEEITRGTTQQGNYSFFFFGKICKLKSTISCANTVKQIRYNVFKGNSNTCWGSEKVAVVQFTEQNNLTVDTCDLLVDKDFPFLGASSYGLIGNNAIKEVKCPASIKLLTPTEAVTSKQIRFMDMKNGNPKLKNDDSYMYKVQGTFQILEQKIFPKFHKFYFNCLLPEIIDSRYVRKLPIREPEYIMKVQESLSEKG
ncbi:hypothetical protein PR048_001524 [Dryococelus australis]|uniref:Mutator-like transposase domain-containing protein n=1 Tax=Dryococelus australis TaxID=614101 RepID=A0ABQ9IIM2_9NEOP|nr:hypothetical protein PR048_001524 [Dryococelus australis]